VSSLLRLPEGFKYSAMPQGEATSALLRAWKVTNNIKFMRCAERAFNLMMTPVEEGGATYYHGGLIFLEECPGNAKNTILNDGFLPFLAFMTCIWQQEMSRIKNYFFNHAKR